MTRSRSRLFWHSSNNCWKLHISVDRFDCFFFLILISVLPTAPMVHDLLAFFWHALIYVSHADDNHFEQLSSWLSYELIMRDSEFLYPPRYEYLLLHRSVANLDAKLHPYVNCNLVRMTFFKLNSFFFLSPISSNDIRITQLIRAFKSRAQLSVLRLIIYTAHYLRATFRTPAWGENSARHM